MFIDVCVPEEEEEKYIELAERLGISALCFLYRKPKQIDTGFKTYTGKFGVSKNGFFVAPKITNSLLNSRKAQFFVNADNNRYIGLTQTQCKLAAANEKTILFALAPLLSLSRRNIGIAFKDIKLLRKFKCKIIFCSYATSPLQLRSVYELKAVASCMGFSPEEVSSGFSVLYRTLHRNLFID